MRITRMLDTNVRIVFDGFDFKVSTKRLELNTEHEALSSVTLSMQAVVNLFSFYQTLKMTNQLPTEIE